MVLVRRIRSRGANIVVEANGEILFAATGDVGQWTRRFSNKVTSLTRGFAPTNKRPRWGHYGKPLKQTITSSTTYQPGRFKVYSAVGSTAPHAYYVDQGTGVFAGNAPYEAKVLPPWQHGGASLYEHTWRPSKTPGVPGSKRVSPVMIRGQEGQFFFAKGLKAGFAFMRMRSFQVPGDAQVSQALATFPAGLANFVGNTPSDGAFVAQLQEWRAWRDEAWSRGEGLGRGGGIGSRAQERFRERARAGRSNRPPRNTSGNSPANQPAPTQGPTLRDRQNVAVAAFTAQNPGVRILGRITSGLVVRSPVDGRRYVIPWSRLYNLID